MIWIFIEENNEIWKGQFQKFDRSANSVSLHKQKDLFFYKSGQVNDRAAVYVILASCWRQTSITLS